MQYKNEEIKEQNKVGFFTANEKSPYILNPSK